MVVKFAEQSTLIMDALEASGCYDPVDGFFYDLLTDASGDTHPVRVQTLVGVIPALPAIAVPRRPPATPELTKRFARRLDQHGRHRDPGLAGPRHRREPAPAAVRRSPRQAARILATLFDEDAFCRRTACVPCPNGTAPATGARPAGRDHPVRAGRVEHRDVRGKLELAGPVWFPINYLIIRELLQYDQFLGPDFTMEYPPGSGER